MSMIAIGQTLIGFMPRLRDGQSDAQSSQSSLPYARAREASANVASIAASISAMRNG